ncbi:MAG: NUDIX hydrolase [Pleurocapsa minor GSE-CHR-MK-17-07R]|nr:NUDIX hydrolase [Pleurocapsa minor GSE-CHR-MK 17-07R]
MTTPDIQPEISLQETTVYSGRVVTLILADIQLANGSTSKREVVRHPGGVGIVALDEKDHVLLVRQYRFAAGRMLLEIPAGTLEPGEDPFVCAERELQEETGYKPGRLLGLGGIYLAPGYTSEFLHLFLARELQESSLPMDDDEAIHLERVPVSEALAMIERGDIIDSKSIVGLMRVARQLGL